MRRHLSVWGQNFSPRIFVSDSDFVAITKNGALCNAKGHLGPREFENVMREQVRVSANQGHMSARVGLVATFPAFLLALSAQMGQITQNVYILKHTCLI